MSTSKLSSSDEDGLGNKQSTTTANLVIATPFVVFPVKLHQMLNDVEEAGHSDIVSWSPDGRSFKIHDRPRFVRCIMPSYFGSSKFRSFQRNLNLWNFAVSKKFQTKGYISHPKFLRDCPEMYETMKREKVKNKKFQQALPASSPSRISKPQEAVAAAELFSLSAGAQMPDFSSWESSSPRSQARSVQHSFDSHFDSPTTRGRMSASSWPLPSTTLFGSTTTQNKEHVFSSQHHAAQQHQHASTTMEEELRNLVFPPPPTTSTPNNMTQEELLRRLHLLRATLSARVGGGSGGGNANASTRNNVANLWRQPLTFPVHHGA